MPVRRLREQLDWLSDFADFVRLDEIMEVEATDRWKVAVTIDDGYYNNISMAFPVFERHRVPVTWFVCSGFIENRDRMPWWNLLDYVIETRRGESVHMEVNEPKVFNLADPTDRQRLRECGRNWFLHQQDSVARAARAQLVGVVGGEKPDSAFATREEVIEAAQSPWVSLGGHTVSHPNMACLSGVRLKREVQKSREKLREWTGQPISWFAYPYGSREHLSRAAKRVVREAGFSGAVTTRRAYVRSTQNRFEVPRLTLPTTSAVWKTRAWILGLNTCRRLSRLKRALGF